MTEDDTKECSALLNSLGYFAGASIDYLNSLFPESVQKQYEATSVRGREHRERHAPNVDRSSCRIEPRAGW
jgi:hypothetical protein